MYLKSCVFYKNHKEGEHCSTERKDILPQCEFVAQTLNVFANGVHSHHVRGSLIFYKARLLLLMQKLKKSGSELVG